MMKNNITYPNTSNRILNRIVKEYLELRLHEFESVLNELEKRETSYFYNTYEFHQFSNLSSLNLFLYYGYKEEQMLRECVSFHLLNNSPIRFENLIALDEIKYLVGDNIDYNNFYITEEGIYFLSIVDDQIKRYFIEYNPIKIKNSLI